MCSHSHIAFSSLNGLGLCHSCHRRIETHVNHHRSPVRLFVLNTTNMASVEVHIKPMLSSSPLAVVAACNHVSTPVYNGMFYSINSEITYSNYTTSTAAVMTSDEVQVTHAISAFKGEAIVEANDST